MARFALIVPERVTLTELDDPLPWYNVPYRLSIVAPASSDAVPEKETVIESSSSSVIVAGEVAR